MLYAVLPLLAALARADTLLEIAIATPDLSQLVAVLSDPAYQPVLDLLNQSDANVTLFAPTNVAFNKTLPDVNLDLFLYHVIDSVRDAASFTALQFVPTYQNLSVAQITKAATVQIVFGVPGNVNTTATVTTADVIADNGIAHLVDTILVPPAAPSATAVASGALDGLVAALTKANLVATVDGLPAATIFAPADPAFDATGVQALTTAGLSTTLQYHVLAAVAYSTDIAAQQYTTLTGDSITVTIEGADVYVNGAKVLIPNVLTSTGVVHVIENVLEVPAAPTRTTTENLGLGFDTTFLANLLEDTDYAAVKTLLDTATNFTLFAPNDDAFAALPANLTVADITATLQYHVTADGEFLAADLAPYNVVKSLLTDTPYVNMGGAAQVLVVTKDGAAVAVNGQADVVRANQQSSNNAVAHIVSSVISIPTDVATTATAAGLTELLDAVVYADLATTLTTTPSLTIFAPINSGFAELLAALGAENISSVNQSTVSDLLQQHVVAGSVIYSTDLAPDTTTTITSLEGAEWNVTVAPDGAVTVGNANVLIANVQVDNGVVHVIDRVLGFQAAPTPEPEPSGLSTGEYVGIAVGAIAALGLGYVGYTKCSGGNKREGVPLAGQSKPSYETV